MPADRSTDLAAEGRRLLEEWKNDHSQDPWRASSCAMCKLVWPCPTARLIAAVEAAIALQAKHCGLEFCEAEDEILAKLAEPSR